MLFILLLPLRIFSRGILIRRVPRHLPPFGEGHRCRSLAGCRCIFVCVTAAGASPRPTMGWDKNEQTVHLRHPTAAGGETPPLRIWAPPWHLRHPYRGRYVNRPYDGIKTNRQCIFVLFAHATNYLSAPSMCHSRRAGACSRRRKVHPLRHGYPWGTDI